MQSMLCSRNVGGTPLSARNYRAPIICYTQRRQAVQQPYLARKMIQSYPLLAHTSSTRLCSYSAEKEAIFRGFYCNTETAVVSELAQSEGQRLGIQNDDWFYGEFSFEAITSLLQTINPKEGEVFLDLGSGMGKAVLAAALTQPFSECRGVEFLPAVHAYAEKAAEMYDASSKAAQGTLESSSGGESVWPRHCPQVKLEVGDFRAVDMTTADVIYCFATCFSRDVVDYLDMSFTVLKPGTRVLMASKALTCPDLRPWDPPVVQVEMSHTGGTLPVFVYERI
ncbi:hypothetical protein CYMTET_16616 [Cymbomonas tetramitiformis]|uniref:Histone-lysine N-methyltransferase, H3 lysine-79 specific n=1 Tax=Cymbomonas tetramitiformis TaxID=36881 RepID=A0AAE0GC85_9CHLO|nr:hypothetical protein CYMTET_16616 [Cymbomonas tetramitiformis]